LFIIPWCGVTETPLPVAKGKKTALWATGEKFSSAPLRNRPSPVRSAIQSDRNLFLAHLRDGFDESARPEPDGSILMCCFLLAIATETQPGKRFGVDLGDHLLARHRPARNPGRAALNGS